MPELSLTRGERIRLLVGLHITCLVVAFIDRSRRNTLSTGGSDATSN
jgi:hypothetical protein